MSQSTDHLIDVLRAAGTLALDKSQSEEGLVEQRLLLDRIARRLFELSGVPNEDFSEAAYRLADGTGLEPPRGFAAAYVRWRRDLRHVARICTEMDQNGRTEEILRKFHLTGKPIPKPAKEISPSLPRPAQMTESGLDKETHGIVILAKEPNLTIPQIAARLGICRQTLYKMKGFRDQAEKQGKIKSRGQKAAVRRGHKTKDGRVEAYQEEDE
jgi:hypothetical protein